MSYHVLYKDKFTVAACSAIAANYSLCVPALDFLQCKSNDANFSSSASKYTALFQQYAQHGRPGMSSGLFHEANKEHAIYEFIKGSLRILCFCDKEIVFLTNGYIKKGQKANPQEVAIAIAAKKKYFEGKAK